MTSSEHQLLYAMLIRSWADLDSTCRFIQANSYNWITQKKNILLIPGRFSGFAIIWI